MTCVTQRTCWYIPGRGGRLRLEKLRRGGKGGANAGRQVAGKIEKDTIEVVVEISRISRISLDSGLLPPATR